MRKKAKSQIQFTDLYFRQKLTIDEYCVLRQGETEPPFSGKYLYWDKKGSYRCRVCGQKVFLSIHKFQSDSGWPSFDEAIKNSITIRLDIRCFMIRNEVLCRRCGSHLGHLFYDYATPTGLRYCINSVALRFKKD